ncbi:hypothetical protein H634G_10200 [Metarhizium anisopliae BRIP 53293]|uniref:NLP/P60 protein n=1 Tax=Metarhizium anisopliae BRIP 53293 TaxID=1291518 RepID=A0A0D9NL60_METAN|nr:hypothetical protein H634G_10200 [Metarhizium anisopliae BRIP 53293]KJK89852.1 hypothetical protein H633G_06266 [Metarhizium anisopliae BRIP 53284]
MKFNNLLAYLVVGVTAAVASPVPKPEAALSNLPSLNAAQSGYAKSIIAKAKAAGVQRHGCQAAIATGLVESKLLMYANNAVPASLTYRHGGISSDNDSIGIFQQRASVYKNIACSMDAGCSAGQFFSQMKRIGGWQTLSVGALCQKIQQSSFPDRYEKQVAAAASICSAGGL